MSDPPAQTTTAPSQTLHGEDLLRQLRVGWAPLPRKTLVAMAMGGLRVRMMRSAVTMLSVVLAIAFLTYTGLSNRLTDNLALAVQEKGAFTALDGQEVAAATVALAGIDPFAELPVERQRALASELGMASTLELDGPLLALPAQFRRAVDELAKGSARLEEVLADPESLPAEEETATQAILDATAEVARLLAEYAALVERKQLALWVRSDGRADPQRLAAEKQTARLAIAEAVQSADELTRGHAAGERLAEHRTALHEAQRQLALWTPQADDAGAGAQAARLHAALRERYAQAVGLLRSPGRMSDADLAALERLLPLAAPHAEPRAHARAAEALRQEAITREQTELITHLRRAGVNWEERLTGSKVMDYWLITMAMLTCAIGIANAMLMSVTERFREIGTMKCLGAQDGMVIQLFLLESAFLGVIGALMGIGLGVLVAMLAGVLQFGRFGVSYFPWSQSGLIILASLGAGVFLTVVGAFGPAQMASRMRPVDALRVDE